MPQEKKDRTIKLSTRDKISLDGLILNYITRLKADLEKAKQNQKDAVGKIGFIEYWELEEDLLKKDIKKAESLYKKIGNRW